MEGRVILAFAFHKLCNFFVHLPRAETAPAGDDERLVSEAQRLPGLLPLCRRNTSRTGVPVRRTLSGSG